MNPQAAREVDYLKKVKRRGWKRAALAVLWPLLLLIALAVVIDDPGPVFYRQVRCLLYTSPSPRDS